MEQYENELNQLNQILSEVIDVSRPIEPQIMNVLKTLSQDPNVMKSPLGKFLQSVDPQELVQQLTDMQSGGNAGQENMPQEAPVNPDQQTGVTGEEGAMDMGEPLPQEALQGQGEEEEDVDMGMRPPMAKRGMKSMYGQGGKNQYR